MTARPGDRAIRRLTALAAALLLIACSPVRLIGQDSVGALRNPEIVQERARTDSLDNAALVQALEKRLKCTCGCNLDVYTCRTTDFTCQTSPAMHRDVLSRLAADSAGLTQASVDRVIAAFVAQYGESILMQPPRRGFNWTAYLMPFVALLVGLAIVGAFARRMLTGHRASDSGHPEEAAGYPMPAGSALTEAERQRLRRELESMES